MITDDRKRELNALGYEVEDMGKEYGIVFEGQFRFVNDLTGDFQDSEPNYSEDDAWMSLNNHNRPL